MKVAIAALGVLASAVLARPPASSSNTPSSATPSATARPEPLSYSGYALIAQHPGSPLDQQPISAVGQGFWIGVGTSTFCPSPEVSDCGAYTTNVTAIAPFNGCSMIVDVPGGQSCFVDGTTGAMRYTAPHSSQMPNSAIAWGFEFQNTTQGDPAQLGSLAFHVNGATGFVACPACDPQSPSTDCKVWSLRANVQGTNTTGCVDITVGARWTPALAWEYA